MKPAGRRRPSLWAALISLAIIVGTVAFADYTWERLSLAPSTDNGSIDADVVHVAAAVGGRIVDLPVEENSRVAKGDLLFQIDPVAYRLAVQQAEGDLALAEAALGTQQRLVSTQRSAAAVAADQVNRAISNLDLATRTVERQRPLAAKGFVAQQQLDNAETAERDARTSLEQARVQEAAAIRAIDTVEGAEATVRARQAALAIAKRALDDTTVRATHPGRVVGLTVRTGEMVVPSQSLFTLVTDDEWFAVGNFRETELHAIKVGDCVTVYSMIDRTRPIRGVVQGVGAGVLDTGDVHIPRSVPYVERSLNWVTVSQRFPVRVRLEDPPEELMRLGATAVAQVKHGEACK